MYRKVEISNNNNINLKLQLTSVLFWDVLYEDNLSQVFHKIFLIEGRRYTRHIAKKNFGLNIEFKH